MSPTRRIPSFASSPALFPPIPGTLPTGSAARKRATDAGGTIVRPSGLFMSEAIFATSFETDTPTEHVSEVRTPIRAFIDRAARSGSPKRCPVPVKSTKASSTDTCSTSGENSSRHFITARETST